MQLIRTVNPNSQYYNIIMTQSYEYFLNPKDEEMDLADTGITVGYVAQRLADNNGSFQEQLQEGKISRVEVQDITEISGSNARILRCIFEFGVEANEAKTFSVIAKLCTVNKEQRVNNLMTETHKRECSFYERYAKKNILPLPEIYHIQRMHDNVPGVILMEDLSGSAYDVGFIEGINVVKVYITLIRILIDGI